MLIGLHFLLHLDIDFRLGEVNARTTKPTGVVPCRTHLLQSFPSHSTCSYQPATHGATVLRVCRAVLSRVDADDAWSETFLSAMTAYPELPGDANVEAWLVKIAHRKAIDVTRAAARRPGPVTDVPDGPSMPGTDLQDFELSRALAALSSKQREVLVYHYVVGLPYQDVAALIGISADAARRSAADGIANLRQTYPGIEPQKGRVR